MKEAFIFDSCTGFQWDHGNLHKHNVFPMECEQVFFNVPILFGDDLEHSKGEKRYYILGKTDEGRKLFVAFTIRDNLIRVISTRDMSKKERKIYERQENTEV